MKRFTPRRAGIALLAACIVAAGLLSAAAAEDRVTANGVADVGFTVDDLDRSVAFFTGVLGFEKTSEVELAGADWEARTGVFGARSRVARLRLGQETIELTDYLAPRGRRFPEDTRANDLWFQHIAIVVADMDAAYAKLRAAGVEHASTGPQRLPDSLPAAAGIRAFYFRDPDGHFLELIEFPPGKGEARWHDNGSGRPLFLGIDHTAIVVRDTARALAFYRDRLGLAVAGTSENFGTEQEHLNNVEHAHLRITTLKSPAGPAIELLEYLAPRDGRQAAQPIRANDLAYWRTRIAVDAVPDGAAKTIHDEDGHALELTMQP